MSSHTITTELEFVEKTDTILIGYAIAHADLPQGRKMNLIASGNTVRFTVEGVDGYVDLHLDDIAEQAAQLLGAGSPEGVTT